VQSSQAHLSSPLRVVLAASILSNVTAPEEVEKSARQQKLEGKEERAKEVQAQRNFERDAELLAQKITQKSLEVVGKCKQAQRLFDRGESEKANEFLRAAEQIQKDLSEVIEHAKYVSGLGNPPEKRHKDETLQNLGVNQLPQYPLAVPQQVLDSIKQAEEALKDSDKRLKQVVKPKADNEVQKASEVLEDKETQGTSRERRDNTDDELRNYVLKNIKNNFYGPIKEDVVNELTNRETIFILNFFGENTEALTEARDDFNQKYSNVFDEGKTPNQSDLDSLDESFRNFSNAAQNIPTLINYANSELSKPNNQDRLRQEMPSKAEINEVYGGYQSGTADQKAAFDNAMQTAEEFQTKPVTFQSVTNFFNAYVGFRPLNDLKLFKSTTTSTTSTTPETSSSTPEATTPKATTPETPEAKKKGIPPKTIAAAVVGGLAATFALVAGALCAKYQKDKNRVRPLDQTQVRPGSSQLANTAQINEATA
jgi:hypothetical protein